MQASLNFYQSILLVDDDEDDCYIFRKAVSEIFNDPVVTCVSSSDNLVMVLDNFKPSIVFIDFYLPKLNGLDCLHLIRNCPGFENVPVIFWSSSLAPQNIISAYNAGALHCFEKPCNFIDLVVKLRELFKLVGRTYHDLRQFSI